MSGLLIYLLAAAIGAAEPASASPPTAAAPAKPAKDEMVCTYQTEKDSHFKKRVCMTRAQRDALSAEERNNLMNKQRTFCAGANC
jgi:hypothetical protein